jgi:hypothetical protein
MFNQLLQQHIDNTYRGHKLALPDVAVPRIKERADDIRSEIEERDQDTDPQRKLRDTS